MRFHWLVPTCIKKAPALSKGHGTVAKLNCGFFAKGKDEVIKCKIIPHERNCWIV